MIIKIFDLGVTATRDEIARGIRYAADMGAHIISCSWGSRYYNQAIADAIEYCHERGILVVSAAGNSRRNIDQDPDYPSSYGFPNQIVVGATDNQDAPGVFANYGELVDISAPGSYIFSLMPRNQYRAFSGTSQATPMVAAAAALLMAHEPELTHLEVKERLIRTSDKFVPLKRYTSSAGRLNVYNLLTDTPGRPLPPEPDGDWIELPYDLESPHPYPNDADLLWTIEVPDAKAIKVHFERFEFANSGDWLDLRCSEGQLVERLNSRLEAFWSEPVPGSKVLVNLKSNPIVNYWGFKIDRISYIPR